MAEETTTKLVQTADLVNMAVLNDTLYPRKAAVTAEIDEKIAARIGSIYTPAGSIEAVADLPALTVENLGKLVNVETEFTTTEDFLDGAGHDYPAGTNVAVVGGSEEGTLAYDVMSGFYDFTAYAKSETVSEDLAKKVDKLEGMGLSTNDYTDADKAKLASLEIASSAEVQDAVKAALGLTGGAPEEEPEG